MNRRSRLIGSVLLPVILMVSLIPQSVLALDASPHSSMLSPDCYHADFGDLPDTYHTTLGNHGAYHDQGNLRLGAAFDYENNGTPMANALGDDLVAGGDDEDGVDFAPPTRCSGATLQFTVTVTGGSGRLGAWFDWNQNGDWDAGEGISQAVTAGSNVVTVVCPASFDDRGVLNARFRLYAGAPTSVNPTGGVANGEVEDYTWTFTPTAARIVGFAGGARTIPLQGVAALAIVATTAVFGAERLRRRQPAAH